VMAEKGEAVYASRKRTCPFCDAPIWLALTGSGVVCLGQDPAKEGAHQHDCDRKAKAKQREGG